MVLTNACFCISNPLPTPTYVPYQGSVLLWKQATCSWPTLHLYSSNSIDREVAPDSSDHLARQYPVGPPIHSVRHVLPRLIKQPNDTQSRASSGSPLTNIPGHPTTSQLLGRRLRDPQPDTPTFRHMCTLWPCPRSTKNPLFGLLI